ncbi:flagellar basal body rod protein FlgC [Zavarzinia aquatilis]|uniref:Flagellar basal-body rod protein FlgC n=1 Tax=Zavarzinia aquatilis TaxID=2211142 RepID=A0A317DVZ4_9PROT|nr:flagellar basal body rod protein FlgC [Zavarzinia aquatilis]PWR18572.1 flagellar basal body rod protein FlgC [Zavarzinia aquatilis]
MSVDDLTRTMMISAAGMRAQSVRMRVIAENMANAETVGMKPGDEPYRRKVVTFASELDKATGAAEVKVKAVTEDQSPFGSRFDPGHPAADGDGYVKTPNVNTLVEVSDMRQAQRTYEANLNVIDSARGMLMRTIDLLRS